MQATRGELGLALVLGAATTLIHIVTAEGYGIFRDELYYLACGENLRMGYVDHPPFVAFVARFARSLFGDSVTALRIVPALGAGATVTFAMLMAREFGGRRWAQALTGVLTALAPVYLGIFGYLSMNAIDFTLWSAALLVLAHLLRTGQLRLWLVFGVVVGVGLQNKLSMGFLGLGVVVGLLVARRWQHFRSRWLWLGGAVALLLFLPYLVWQIRNGWPTLEFVSRALQFKNVALSPFEFAQEQVLMMNPVALPVFLAGIVFLLVLPSGRTYRPLGWAFVAVVAILMSQNSKPYYLAPSYTLVFAAGSVVLARLASALQKPWLRTATVGLITFLVVASGFALAPLAKPVLPIESFVAYMNRLGMAPSTGENHELGRLPQFFADRLGWRELAETVARVYETLPPEDQARACIFGQNYGQAGAIDYFGGDLGLPKAMSGHNSYWSWGPGDCTGEVVIVMGGSRDGLESRFESVEQATVYTCKDCMPYENNKPIWICRRMRLPIETLWPQLRHYD